MTALIRRVLAAVLAGCIAGCAAPPSMPPSAVVTSPRATFIPAERAKHAVAIGQSTKADVVAALGEALVIRFDTGYEVWVYWLANHTRDKASTTQQAARPDSEQTRPETGGEFVILFAPSGVAAKTRVRPAPRG